MSYNTYTKDRVLPVIPMMKSYTSYMKVENVLRWMNINVLGIHQYKIGNEPVHFFKCIDVASKMTSEQFRIMECNVTQYLIEVK